MKDCFYKIRKFVFRMQYSKAAQLVEKGHRDEPLFNFAMNFTFWSLFLLNTGSLIFVSPEKAVVQLLNKDNSMRTIFEFWIVTNLILRVSFFQNQNQIYFMLNDIPLIYFYYIYFFSLELGISSTNKMLLQPLQFVIWIFYIIIILILEIDYILFKNKFYRIILSEEKKITEN